MFKNLIILFAIITVAITVYSCKDPVTGNIENQAPNTYLSLFPDSVISPGTTLKTINWWGDDADGFVQGYRISFDSINWTFTTSNDSTFLLSINGNDSTFKFFVAAVDDKGAVDLSPASNRYPVVNSLPSVEFAPDTQIPDTTFPVASFKWIGTDPDGNNTIRAYYYALNDTSSFREIQGNLDIITLINDPAFLINQNNVFYLKAQDNAGAFSNTIRMPEADTGRAWYIKPATGRVLLIKDMPDVEVPRADDFFAQVMDTVQYSTINIKTNNGSLIPKIVNPMFIETLKLFQVVIWSGNRGNVTSDNPNFDLAQRTLPFYLQSGRKLFWTSGFPNAEAQTQGNLVNFAPVDSVKNCTTPFLFGNTQLTSYSSGYPPLQTNAIIQRVRGIAPFPTAKVIYKLPYSTTCQDSTTVAVKDTEVNPKNIFMALAVYLLDSDINTAKQLFRKILFEEFGL